jgi:hypothetical protein
VRPGTYLRPVVHQSTSVKVSWDFQRAAFFFLVVYLLMRICTICQRQQHPVVCNAAMHRSADARLMRASLSCKAWNKANMDMTTSLEASFMF